MAFILANGILAAAALITYAERRVVGRFQSRLGPNRVGPFGLLQPIADVVKLLLKEDVIPRQADRLLFNLAPIVVVAPVFLLLAVIPFGKNSFLADVNIGILFVIAVTTVSMIGFFLAGWGSGNRYAMLGAMRAIAQLVSYEVPMVLSIVGGLLLTGSLSLVRIVEAQSLPFILLQPL
ncbi:MAG: NADH-quinone oxidoreductase subunit H, partial [Chloroflexi bacterium]|nr:NADH-quinone oxidoreductase subunit H [Chloroflexota bacterium]